jgi:hypothetical protein
MEHKNRALAHDVSNIKPVRCRPVSQLSRILGPGNYRSISRRVGLSPQHVGRVLRGIKGASFWVGASIADAASVSLDELRAYIRAQPGFNIRGRRTVREIRRRGKAA